MNVPAKTRPEYRMRPVGNMRLDVERLEKDLRGHLQGEVRFRPGDRALYSTGGSNYRQLPIGIVIPKSVEDVIASVAVCREHDAPVLSRGGGTSLAGQSSNVAVMIDFSKYLNEVLQIDAERRTARVQPGLILDHLRHSAEKGHQLTYGPDPSTHDHCTLGGMIGNNSCGTHSVMAEFHGPGPLTADQVVELDVLTYRGERFTLGRDHHNLPQELEAKLHALAERYGDRVRERYPDIPRRVSGYNLDRLLPEKGFNLAAALTGTESTCVTILEATVELIPNPKVRSLVVLGYEDEAIAGDHVPEVREHRPLGLEGVDHTLMEDMRIVGMHDEDLSLLPDGRGFLLVEFGGETKDEADEKAHKLIAAAKKHKGLKGTKLYDDEASEKHLWEVREAGLGATAFIPGKPDTYEGWEDSAVPPEKVGDYLRRLKKLGSKFGYESALYGHYGQGCIHARWNFDLVTKDGIKTFRRFLDEASDLVLELGGSLSGEHGDGQSRAELLPKMFGDDLVEGFREFKAIWDPDWKMNPGKVVDAYRITDNLRLGTDYAPPKVKTHFAFAKDGGSFAHATTRCVGIGKCRRTDSTEGVMCPSFMVTREEKHTTRGRARTLWEMLNGEEIKGGFRSKEAFEALDLCLACKGCTNDCPVSVDMPTLKAEFLSHHYEGRLRPRHAYAFGLIDQGSRLASRMPALVNLLSRTPVFKAAAGIALRRDVPRYAPLTLRDWFHAREPARGEGERVLLWPDTFNNYFHTDTGVAAIEALEAAGFEVTMPRIHLCCGRPLYDYGMLDLAKSYLQRVVATLREEIRAGVPLIAIEPSCAAVFKDELPQMLPDDEDAKRLCKRTFHFSEFLAEHADGWEPPRREGKALLHGHCHHLATGGIAGEKKLLERIGLEVEELNAGCCGMAGSWGFEPGHYDISQKIGERVLLPRVRQAARDTLIVADGFSCKEQIRQGETGREALHVAQVLKLAREGCSEEEVLRKPEPAGNGTKPLVAGAALGAALAGAAWIAHART